MSRAHIWDASAVATLDVIETHYARHDVKVTITGMNRGSEELHTTLSGTLTPTH